MKYKIPLFLLLIIFSCEKKLIAYNDCAKTIVYSPTNNLTQQSYPSDSFCIIWNNFYLNNYYLLQFLVNWHKSQYYDTTLLHKSRYYFNIVNKAYLSNRKYITDSVKSFQALSNIISFTKEFYTNIPSYAQQNIWAEDPNDPDNKGIRDIMTAVTKYTLCDAYIERALAQSRCKNCITILPHVDF